MTAAAALALGGIFSGCTKDTDFSGSGGLSQDPIKNYEEAFISTFGRPVDGLDWGFGSSSAATRAFTRATMPSQPTFRDNLATAITQPTMPTTYHNTGAEVMADTNIKYAKNYQNYQKGDVIYINTEYSALNNPQNTDNLTIYVDGNVTYLGGTSANENGTVFCVTSGSTLKLGSVSNNLTVYLAPNATLDITQGLDWQGNQATSTYWSQELGQNVTADNNTFNFQNSHAAIYMSAGSQVKAADLSLVGGAKLLNAGGTITATNLTLDQTCTLWNEGTINVTNTLTLTNTGCGMYNASGKTITAGKIDLINNDCLLYNEGTVKSNGEIKLHNSSAEIVNNGTLEGTALNMGAGGKMHNVGTTTISGKTDLTNSNSKWMNDGQYTSGSFDVDNYSKQNYNNCKLTVLGNFHLNRGEFVLNADASVVCSSFTWEDTSNFWLNSKSMVKVENTLLTQNANSDYGFRGVGSDYAVIQAKEIAHEGNEQFRMSYFGKLYVDTEKHFGQWYKDAPSNTNQPAYYHESSVKFSFTDAADANVVASTAPVSIPSGTCSPGYTGGGNTGGGGGTTGGGGSTTTVRVIAEDLNLEDTKKADFDFNDVVFDVEWSGSQLKITLQAAGGTLPLTVGDPSDLNNPTYETDQSGFENLKYEVHRRYKVSTRTMVNTQAAGGVDRDPVSFIIDNPRSGETDLKVIANYIPIRVYKGEKWVELPVATTVTRTDNLTACKLGVDGSYSWCTERSHIDTTFPYIDSRKNNRGSRFKLYLAGELTGQWWKESTKLADDN